MKTMCGTLLFVGVLYLQSASAQESAATQSELSLAPVEVAVQGDTPAQQAIETAKRQLTAHPKKVQAFTDLALAYVKRACETADPRYLRDAEEALSQGINLDPKDFQLQKAQVAVLLAKHEYGKAREQAEALNRRTPDDVMTYGFIAEADIALGNYEDAEQSAQWMMNMLRNNVPALLIGARLRVLYGDSEGAIDFLKLAYSETSPSQVEELAWIADQIAAVQIDSGKTDEADNTLVQASNLFPVYADTLENLARVRLAQQRAKEAVDLLLQARQIDPNPDVVYRLAEARNADGKQAEARTAFAEFEKLATDEASATEEGTRDLILMYADDDATAPAALNLAQREMDQRHDVWTLDAYARALYANGRFEEADVAIQKALAVGIQSAQIFDHAGHIALKHGHPADASKYFHLAIQTNPTSVYAADARSSIGSSGSVEETGVAIRSLQLGEKKHEPEILPSASAVEGNDGNGMSVSDGSTTVARNASRVFSPVPRNLLVPRPTETEQRIKSAQARVERNPNDGREYAGLGAAYYQRARETGNVDDFELAEQSLNKSLDLVSGDFAADEPLKSMAEVCMGEHRFADAVTYSQKALSLGSGDVSPFAIIGDAYADMGEYEKAGRAYERLTPRDMVLSPHAAYARDSRIAYLKFIAGDTPQAISMMKIAVAEGIEARLPGENLAWLYFELGEFNSQNGDVAGADAAYLSALTTHPGDYRALAGLGKLRGNQGRYAEAILLYQKAIAIVPMPIFVAELGDLYAKSGNQSEASNEYQLVEYIGLLGHINQVLHNRDLALFYADHDIKLTEALDLARKELEIRHDIYTWDALAWALYKNGKYADAAKASERALQFGTRDSLLLYHAGVIAEAAGMREQERDALKAALEINPHFHLLYADSAKQKLDLLDAQMSASAKGESDAR